MRPVRFAQSARKHRIGHAHVRYVMAHDDPVITPGTDTVSERHSWIGTDDRGVELEVIALVQPDYLLVIHVMPTYYRRQAPNNGGEDG